MQNRKLIAKMKDLMAQHNAGELSDGAFMAKATALTNRYKFSHAARVNTQDNEVRMGCSRKTQPRQNSGHQQVQA